MTTGELQYTSRRIAEQAERAFTSGAYVAAANRRACCSNGCESIGPDWRQLHRHWFSVHLDIATELRRQGRIREAFSHVASARRCRMNAVSLPR